MNVTELARILKVTPAELFNYLPQMGFDIGQRAIKVDNPTARKIIAGWPQFLRKLQRQKLEQEKNKQIENQVQTVKHVLQVPPLITVRQFAEMSGLPVSRLLAQLMKNGVFASLNERIDFDTASVVGADLGLQIEPAVESLDAVMADADKLKEVLSAQDAVNLTERPPVIVVMGHVDHGKTMLLDAIRKTNVIATEAGGITQHIGAYQVERKGRLLTFIDTPGHEAFTAMRNRGASVADIAILVVAADDGVKPQTVEALRIIEAAKLPFVVAINKIDKPEADVEKVKQELATQLNLVSEDWSGKTVMVPISAKKGEHLDELLDMLLLLAETSATNLRANPQGQAAGIVVESRVDKGEGTVATILIQNGTLRLGDNLVCAGINYGKVRGLKNHNLQNLDSAGPAAPVKVIGWRLAPAVGDAITVGEGAKVKKTQLPQATVLPTLTIKPEEEQAGGPQINLVLKTDTLGSGEAIEASLAKLDTLGVKIKIVYKGLGNISENDAQRADSSGAKILGFNVNILPQTAELARINKVVVKRYQIIYELLNDLKAEVQELVKPEIKRVDLGRIKILAIFRDGKNEQIVGGSVTKGLVKPESLVEVERDDQLIGQGQLKQLQSGRQNVDQVEQGGECGLQYSGNARLQVGDFLQIYQEEKIYKKVQ